jgi:outer membrane biosynthesis protein TonB
LGTTIQALEVQRMTLSTLQGMNLPLADLAESLRIKTPAPAPAPEPAPQPAQKPAQKPRTSASRNAAPTTKPAGKSASAAVDPVQWWGALTQQFTELATQALKDTGADAARNMAGSLVKQSVGSATGALKRAASMPAQAAAGLMGAASGRAGASKKAKARR